MPEVNGLDYQFLERVYGGDFNRYLHRLQQIGFQQTGIVLDAGSGFGQWSVALNQAGNKVFSLEIENNRSQVLGQIISQRSLSGIYSTQGCLEEIPFRDESFDAVFSFSVLYFTNYAHSIDEIHRVLRRGGKLYINTNDLGWFLYLLFSGHNSSQDYQPRIYAAKSIMNTLFSLEKKYNEKNGSQYIAKSKLLHLLRDRGFKIVAVGGDGGINLPSLSKQIPFFRKSFMGIRATYEVLAEKECDI